MDITTFVPGQLDGVAARLEQQAARLDVCAAQVRVATPVSWRGEAAEAHGERVARLAADLVDLADRVQGCARLVRRLQSVAEARLDLLAEVDLSDVDLTVWMRP